MLMNDVRSSNSCSIILYTDIGCITGAIPPGIITDFPTSFAQISRVSVKRSAGIRSPIIPCRFNAVQLLDCKFIASDAVTSSQDKQT